MPVPTFPNQSLTPLPLTPGEQEAFNYAYDSVKCQLALIPPHLYYHSIEHTFNWVLPWCDFLAEKEQIDTHHRFLLRLAALYHDTGYLDCYNDNEIFGANRCISELKQFDCFSPHDLEILHSLIMITSLSTNPLETTDSRLQQLQFIIRDADVAQLASESFHVLSDRLRREVSHVLGREISPEAWTASNNVFLNKHQWFSTTAKKEWTELKRLYCGCL
ncbi:hypothetical protein RCL1_001009 [Eukaryota sp. TZLM3-RCL]